MAALSATSSLRTLTIARVEVQDRIAALRQWRADIAAGITLAPERDTEEWTRLQSLPSLEARLAEIERLISVRERADAEMRARRVPARTQGVVDTLAQASLVTAKRLDDRRKALISEAQAAEGAVRDRIAAEMRKDAGVSDRVAMLLEEHYSRHIERYEQARQEVRAHLMPSDDDDGSGG